MLRTYVSVIICYLLFLICGYSQSEINKIEAFNTKSLLHNIKTLSSDAFEGRKTGTPGALKAEKYIIQEFVKHNVLPLGETFQQPFRFFNDGIKLQGVNVIGVVKGTLFPDSYIVLSAHYDHEGIKNNQIYNGADDDASGVSALFSFAEYFKVNPPQHSVILAAFDAEEMGLQGSKFYVNSSIIPLKDIMVNLNMDMISRSDKNELFAVGTVYNKTLDRVISQQKYSTVIKLIKGHDSGDWKNNWTYSSDHASFHQRGIPFLYFGVEDHVDYHQPTDDFENINQEFYIEAVKVIISVFEKIDSLQF